MSTIQGRTGVIQEYQGSVYIKQDLKIWNGTEFVDITSDNITFLEKYDLYTDIPITGPDSLILVNDDNSINGDNTESQLIRHNNKLFYLAAVEQ